jgi:hypothetical protein
MAEDEDGPRLDGRDLASSPGYAIVNRTSNIEENLEFDYCYPPHRAGKPICWLVLGRGLEVEFHYFNYRGDDFASLAPFFFAT